MPSNTGPSPWTHDGKTVETSITPINNDTNRRASLITSTSYHPVIGTARRIGNSRRGKWTTSPGSNDIAPGRWESESSIPTYPRLARLVLTTDSIGPSAEARPHTNCTFTHNGPRNAEIRHLPARHPGSITPSSETLGNNNPPTMTT